MRKGQPATDLELYMGMPGHAIFVGRDRRVFCARAPVRLGSDGGVGDRDAGRASSHAHHGTGLPAAVSFPFGLPAPGDYRIFVQVKRSGRIETGAFDARVE